LILKSVELEAKRQLKLVNEKKKVNSEVRKVLPNGETEFLRPMPGAARMYPETDLPLLKISHDLINEVKKSLPKLRSETEKELKEEGLNEEMIKILLNENKVEEFKEFFRIIKNPKLVFKILLLYPKEIASKEKIPDENINEILNRDILFLVVKSLKDKKIFEIQVKHVLERIAKGLSFEEAIKFEKKEIHEIEEKILKLIREKPGLSENAYMGLVMKEFHGKISGKEAIEIIKKYVK